MMRRRRCGLACLPVGRFHRGWYQVVHESATLYVAVFVVPDLLHESDGKPFGQAAMDLALHDHWINDVAAIVHSNKTADFDLTRALVDIDNSDISAERERQVRRIVIV